MTITTQHIEETKAFQSFEKFVQAILLKRKNIVLIIDAFIIYNNTGYINPNIGEKATKILKELIEKPKQLYTMVKALEIQEFKKKQFDDSFEERAIEFMTGFDVAGNPIICIHKVVFKKEMEKQSKKYLQSNAKGDKIKAMYKCYLEQKIVKQW